MQSAPTLTAVRSESVSGRFISWKDVIPPHRLPVVSKTLVMVALGVYMTGGRFSDPLVWSAMALAAALWAALYTLNEATDIVAEQGGRVAPGMWAVLFGLPFLLCLLALRVSAVLSLLLFLMFLGQWAYCAPPLRLKRHWWAILVLSGGVNPLLRVACGALWGTRELPLLVYLTIICLHIGATLRARLLQRDRDVRLAYSVVPLWSARIGRLCTILGFAGTYALCAQSILPPSFVFYITLSALFSLYAWSGRAKSMAQLRRGWVAFALIAVGIVAALLVGR